jgi:hypothetical protein
MDVNEEHSEKQLSSIVITEFGIEMDTHEDQPEKQ